MKLKQALIEGGIVYGNPDFNFPDKNDYLIDDDGVERYQEAAEFWYSGRLPFEDQDKVKEVLRVDKIMDAFENGKLQKLIDGKFDKHKDGLYSVDLDVTVVEQVYGHGKWNDRMFTGEFYKLPSRKYRKVLRIKP